MKYGFVTDLTSLVVEENENYLIKIHDPEKLKYDITYQVDEYSVVSQPLETSSNLDFQEIKIKIEESGKNRFLSIFNLLNNIPIRFPTYIIHKYRHSSTYAVF